MLYTFLTPNINDCFVSFQNVLHVLLLSSQILGIEIFLNYGVTLKHGVPQWGTPLLYLLVYPNTVVFGQVSETF